MLIFFSSIIISCIPNKPGNGFKCVECSSKQMLKKILKQFDSIYNFISCITKKEDQTHFAKLMMPLLPNESQVVHQKQHSCRYFTCKELIYKSFYQKLFQYGCKFHYLILRWLASENLLQKKNNHVHKLKSKWWPHLWQTHSGKTQTWSHTTMSFAWVFSSVTLAIQQE